MPVHTYTNWNLRPSDHEETQQGTIQVPDNVDPELLEKLLGNPEMLALLSSLAKTIK